MLSRYTNKLQKIYEVNAGSQNSILPTNSIYKLCERDEKLQLEIDGKHFDSNIIEIVDYFISHSNTPANGSKTIFIDLDNLFERGVNSNKEEQYTLLWKLFDWLRQIFAANHTQRLHYYLITYDHALHARYNLIENSSIKDFELNIINSASISGMLKTLSLENNPVSAGIISSRKKNDILNEFLNYVYASNICCEELLVDESSLFTSYYEYEEPIIWNNPKPNQTKKGWIISIGGGQGIGFKILTQLSSNFANLLLIGTTSLEKPEWFNAMCFDNLTIKRNAIIEFLKSKNQRITPVNIRREEIRLEKNSKLIENLEKLSNHFNKVEYIQLDINSENAIKTVHKYVQQKDILPSLILGIAGIIKDSLAINKKEDDFKHVIDTKVSTFKLGRFLYELNPSASLLYFTSVASKTGNIGQVDYAIANEFINYGCNMLHWVKNTNKCHAVNWGPWKDAGMATEKVLISFAERGVYPIPLKDGAEYVEHITLDESVYHTDHIVGIYDAKNNNQSIASAYSNLREYPYLNQNLLYIKTMSIDNMTGVFQISADKPYLDGHKKFGQPVLSAAVTTRFIYELFQLWERGARASQHPIQIESKVLNGIICKNNTLQLNFEANTSKGSSIIDVFTFNDNGNKALRYKASIVKTALERNSLVDMNVEDHVRADIVSTKEAYSDLLFHSEIYECICSDIRINRKREVAHAKVKVPSIREQLGANDTVNNGFDPITVDSILQLALVLIQKIHSTSALPAELRVVIHPHDYNAGDIYDCYSKLSDFSEETNTLGVEGALCKDGRIVVEVLKSRHIHSKSL